jgi:Na+-transporting methylmalonyl-CoA/oxaloacetate decarboxylase gamma subunit
MSLLTQGVEVMLLGLAGVFAVLVIFYGVTRAMLAVAKRCGVKPSAPDEEGE